MLKRFALGGVAIFLLVAAATATAALLQVKDVVDIINTGHKIKGIDKVLDNVSGGGPQTILVLGTDGRWSDKQTGDPKRSDTIMLIRLDPGKDATAVMSLPRDLAVNIPGYCVTSKCKLNAAYAHGGPKLAVQVIKSLFGGHFPINHVVSVDFNGFTRAINRLGCVYVDVDRTYFHSNKGIPALPGLRWSAINVKSGYQKLCGRDSLAFVRFRHQDNDEVRAARQQWFLRQAKDQIPLSELFTSREDLLRALAHYTDTDVHSDKATLKLIKLTIQSAGHPVRSIKFLENFVDNGAFVTISQGDLDAARDSFLAAQAAGPTQVRPSGQTTTTKTTTTEHGAAHHKHKHKHASATLAPGLMDDQTAVEDFVADAATRTRFRLYYPRDVLRAGGFSNDDPPRVYAIPDKNGHQRRAYRIVFSTGQDGQYYGVQGLTWTQPPLLEHPSETRVVNGRHLELFYDGSHLRVVAYRTEHAVYWVSNTLSEALTNQQMLGIASSLRSIS